MVFWKWVSPFLALCLVFALLISLSSSLSPEDSAEISGFNFLEYAKKPEVFDWMVEIRRKIHENPELGYEEFKTVEIIKAELDKLGIPYKYPIAGTGLVGFIGSGEPPFVALRADMDALAMEEKVEWQHKSKVPGKMHACGHDAHVAMLLGAANQLQQWRHNLKAHLAATHEDMMEVIEEGPLTIMKANTDATTSAQTPMVPKPRSQWTPEEKKKFNLDNVAKDIILKTLDSNMFLKIKTCTTAKEIWDKLILICQGTEAIKENKLTVAIQKFKNFKMKHGESIDEMDSRFTAIIDELTMLDKTYSNKEMCLKILRVLPSE